jgi:hypothetical protein
VKWSSATQRRHNFGDCGVGTVGGDLDGPALAWRCCSYRVLTVLAEGRQFVEGELAVRDNLTPQDLASCLDELTQRLTCPPPP